MGAGAVGCAFGTQLVKDENNTVFFIARGSHLEAIKRNGLSVQTRKTKFTLKIHASDNPDDFNSKPDLILLTLKSFDTKIAIEQLKSVIFKNTQILSFWIRMGVGSLVMYLGENEEKIWVLRNVN